MRKVSAEANPFCEHSLAQWQDHFRTDDTTHCWIVPHVPSSPPPNTLNNPISQATELNWTTHISSAGHWYWQQFFQVLVASGVEALQKHFCPLSPGVSILLHPLLQSNTVCGHLVLRVGQSQFFRDQFAVRLALQSLPLNVPILTRNLCNIEERGE